MTIAPNPRCTNTGQRGFVLVMTLVVLALASAAMARLANRSLWIVRRGAEAERALEERWTLITCRMAILDRSEELLTAAANEQATLGYGWPYPAELEVVFRLGGRAIRLQVHDENAKLNLNWLQQQRPEDVFSLLSRTAVYGRIPIKLRTSDTKQRSHEPVFGSWGQVVHLAQLEERQDLIDELRPITKAFTCWGHGKVNVSRASDQTLRALLDGLLLPQEIEELIELRRGHQGDLMPLLESLEVPRRRLVMVRPLISTESSTFTMWMTESEDDLHRTRLLVHNPTNRQTPETLVFER